MGQQPPTGNHNWGRITIIAAMIVAIGSIIAGYLAYSAASQRNITDGRPTPTPPIPTPTPTPTPTATPNLITRSHVVAVYVANQSTSTAEVGSSHSTVLFTFNNTKNGTGLALVFDQPLDVTPYHSVEISGTSTKEFSFVIQYKVKDKDGHPQIARESDSQSFPVSAQTPIKVPIVYDREVDEVVINIPTIGQSSTVNISSIQLVK